MTWHVRKTRKATRPGGKVSPAPWWSGWSAVPPLMPKNVCVASSPWCSRMALVLVHVHRMGVDRVWAKGSLRPDAYRSLRCLFDGR